METWISSRRLLAQYRRGSVCQRINWRVKDLLQHWVSTLLKTRLNLIVNLFILINQQEKLTSIIVDTNTRISIACLIVVSILKTLIKVHVPYGMGCHWKTWKSIRRSGTVTWRTTQVDHKLLIPDIVNEEIHCTDIMNTSYGTIIDLNDNILKVGWEKMILGTASAKEISTYSIKKVT